MLTKLVALLAGFFLVACGSDDKKSDPAPTPQSNNCQQSSTTICADDLFDEDDTDDSDDPFDPSDPNNQDPFPGNPGDEDEDEDDDKSQSDDDDDDGKYRSSLRINSIKSYLNLKTDHKGEHTHDGRCHVDVELEGNTLVVDVKRSELKNKSVGFGQSTSCLVNLGVKYSKGYSFTVSKIEMDLITDIDSDAKGYFSLDYSVKSRNSELEYYKTVQGPDKKRHSLELTPKSSKWSSCKGKETLGLKTYFETNFKESKYSSNEWKAGLVAKNNKQIDHGDLYLDDGEYRIKLKWAKCD